MSSLSAESISKAFKKRQVVREASFSISSGEVVGLLGPNGAGKTTSFYMVVGLVKPDHGDVFLDGESIGQLPIHKRARLGLSYLPQEASIFRKLTVTENITVALEAQGYTGQSKKNLKSCCKIFAFNTFATVMVMRFRVVSEGGLKLRGRWRVNLNFCCWMNPLLELTRLLSVIFKRSFAD
jgi:ABC-type lipopolysaccharide export system ATPase subunit